MFQTERGRDFEKRWVRFPIAYEFANFLQAGRNLILRNHFAIHLNSFAESDEVRGGKQAGGIFCRTTDRIDHCADGAFAVCARDVYDPRFTGIDLQLGDQSPNVIQAELDPEALKAVEPGERLFILHDTDEK